MSQTNRLREGLTDNRDYDARGNLVCERCKNTGYYGDTEPGIHGNDEVVACECGNKTLCSIGAHVATDYGWIMWCDKCNLQADMSVARKHRVPPPGTPKAKEGGHEKDMWDDVNRWLHLGETGLSSKAMAAHLSGYPCDGAYPFDPGDFRRCLLFLGFVPAARKHLHKMAEVNSVWAALVHNWNDIEQELMAEAGLHGEKRRRAPHTYDLMQRVISAGRRGELVPSSEDEG